ncbi:MAG: hypothetical protein NVS4B12_01470 [Ktedonobacteraceae bacterium]
MQKHIRSVSIQQWTLLPLRLFLGVTFVYAGIQKILDPQFFQESASGYIGRQITRFALGSPIHGLLTSLAEPHARFFGLLIIFGEIAIGLGMLFGFLFRPAAFFGALLSILFYLSASWHVYPYFYGADIVFTFAWITLLLNGPMRTGLPSLDEILSLRLLQAAPVQYQQRLALLLSIVLGTGTRTYDTSLNVSNQTMQRLPQRQRSRQSVIERNRETRRTFLWGAVTGGAAALGIFAASYALRILRGSSNDATTSGVGEATATPAGTTPASTTTSSTPVGGQIAQVSAVPKNSAISFTIPSSGDAGVLVHLNNDQFVAYDALCTHAGCQVDYDPGSQLLQCPCHGAAFDPAKGAEVVNPPAPTPLSPVNIHIDSATGAISLA